MIDLQRHLSTIRALLAEDSPASLTYAALEYRFALERIAYDRLRNAYDYVSIADIASWTPKQVITALSRLVDPHVSGEVTLSIGRNADPECSRQATAQEFEEIEWTVVGTQSGFDNAKLGRLWNALSGLALHIKLPKSKHDAVQTYGDELAIKSKVYEAVEFIESVSKGNMILRIPAPAVTFTCRCGVKNTRAVELFTPGKKISCSNPERLESYIYELETSRFVRRVFPAVCRGCQAEYFIPLRQLESLAVGAILSAKCKCGCKMRFAWKLMQAE